MSIDHLKTLFFSEIEQDLKHKGLSVDRQDASRPWGGFFVIDEAQAEDFANHFFDGIDINELRISGKLSPKILVVAPQKRLSWQYHHRRAEIWKVVKGTVGVITSPTNDEGEPQLLNPGSLIRLQQGERHRLLGLEDWGVVAEIWQHTDLENPSDEDDIIRIQDDFGR